jgi:hypothetical protein
MIGTSLPAQQTDRKAVAMTNQIALETRLLPIIAGRRTDAGQSARHILLLALLFPVLLGMSSCHKAAATTTTTGVAVAISPTTVSLNVGTSTLFTGSATGGSLNTIVWQVNGTTGGSSTIGTIDTNGNYTAPATVPAGGTVTVEAVSADLSTVQATSTVTVLPPAQVSISPVQASLAAGASQPFSSTVQGAPTSNVIWQVNGQSGDFAAFGFVSSAGVYTAPPSPPPGGTVTVTAVSQSDPTQSASATVTLSFGTAALRGSYAFSLTGTNASGAFSRAGTFTADGSGGLQAGLEDVHDSTGVKLSVSFAGTYALGADGRGTLSFSDGLTPATFRIVLANNSQLQIVGFDTTGSAQGTANLRDPSTFLNSAFNGVYVFDFSGVDSASNVVSQVGEFFANGQGLISNGIEDIDDNGTLGSKVPFTGTYLIAANGRGTATITTGAATSNFAFYVVSRGSAKFMEVDASSAPRIAGYAVQQTPNAAFTLSSLTGNYAFLLTGAAPAGSIATAGSFLSAGNGTLTSGTLDENNNGSIAKAQPFTGSYSIDSTGRGTATFQALSRTYALVFYLTAQGGAVFQETDSSIASDGVTAQQSAPLPQSAFAGSYAVSLHGSAPAAVQNFAGQFNTDVNGNLTAGSLDIGTFPGSPVAGEALTGTLMMSANGRGTLILNPAADNRNFAVYAAGPTLLFAVGVDAGRFAAGSLAKQY